MVEKHAGKREDHLGIGSRSIQGRGRPGRSGRHYQTESGPLNTQNNEGETIQRFARRLGVILSPSALEGLGIFLDELTRWNDKINLTGLKSRQRIIHELLLDCLVPVPYLPDHGTLLDIGAGAGFPGLVLKICNPSLRASLLEPNGKKAAFLGHIKRLCGLKQIEVIQARAGPGAAELSSEGYQVVTARALAGLEETLTLCAPWVTKGGLFVSFQGADAAARLEACQPLLGTKGLVLAKDLAYPVPGRPGERHVLLFRRVASTRPG